MYTVVWFQQEFGYFCVRQHWMVVFASAVSLAAHELATKNVGQRSKEEGIIYRNVFNGRQLETALQ